MPELSVAKASRVLRRRTSCTPARHQPRHPVNCRRCGVGQREVGGDRLVAVHGDRAGVRGPSQVAGPVGKGITGVGAGSELHHGAGGIAGAAVAVGGRAGADGAAARRTDVLGQRVTARKLAVTVLLPFIVIEPGFMSQSGRPSSWQRCNPRSRWRSVAPRCQQCSRYRHRSWGPGRQLTVPPLAGLAFLVSV